MKPWKEWREEVMADNPGDDIIEELLPDAPGEYLIQAGRPGIGKTNLVLYLAFCLATGEPFYGLKVKQCRVGYLTFEGSKHKLNTRIEKIAESFPDPRDNLYIEVSSPYLLTSKDKGRKFYDSIEGLKVAIIDPLRYFAPYSEVKEAAPFISFFKGILKAAGTTGIVNHHVRKRDQRYRIHAEDLIDEVKGAGDFVDSATSVMLLERPPHPKDQKGQFKTVPPDLRILHFVKAKDAIGDLEPLHLNFNRETLLFEKKEF